MNSYPKIVKRLSSGFCLLLIASFIIFSCEKQSVRPNNNSSTDELYQEKEDVVGASEVCGPVLSKSLLMENGFKVGDIQVYNDAQYLYVAAKTLPRFQLGTAYLYVGDKKGIPMSTNGQILYRNFNYIHRVSAFDLQNSHYFKIPLNTISAKNVLVMNIQVFSFDALVNSWAMGGVIDDARYPEIFTFERTICPLSNETKY